MKTTNLRKTNLYESTKSICTSAFAFLLICIPKKIGTSRSLSRFFRGSALLTLLTLLTLNSSANNLAITGVSVAGTTLTFTISWDNSWRVNTPPYNWDAVWVFVKYAVCDGSVSVWQHAGVSTDVSLYTLGGGATNLEFETVSDGMGVFIKRSATNMGGPSNISATVCNVPLTIAPGTYNFKVFGIEMVKIKQENFQVGDASSANGFSSITIDANYETNGIGGNASTIIGGTWTTTSSLPPAYPLGYNEMYCMKYEITQEQYVDFLNCLTYDQQASRTALAPNQPGTTLAMYASASILYRNGIKIKSSGSAITAPKTPAIYDCDLDGNNAYSGPNDGHNVACNYLLWKDLTGYLDWAALRPFTDIEFEKICRGTANRVAAETASGFAYGAGGNNYGGVQTLSNAGANNEVSANNDRGMNYTYSGPTRVGMIPANTNLPNSRGGTFATYYGVLDMSGNVWEQVVHTGDAGRTFTGTLGDGTLSAAGDADVAGWPAGPSYAGGRGLRGGAFNSGWCCWTDQSQTRVSYRAAIGDATDTRMYERGGRGVR